MTNKLINFVSKNAKFYVNAQTNSENRGYNFITKYKNPIMCIDKQELRLSLSIYSETKNLTQLIKIIKLIL